MGFVFFPDFPTTTRAIWLNDQQRALAIRRMDEVGRAPPRRMTVKRFVMVWFQWRTHAYLWTNLMSGLLVNQLTYMSLWLKGILPAAGNMLMFGFNAWVPVLIFPTPKAPVFLVGYSCSAANLDMSGTNTDCLFLLSSRRSMFRGMKRAPVMRHRLRRRGQ
ncbi:hypothetical protein V1504DRAFT_441847 [Lipomyces starkeyi]